MRVYGDTGTGQIGASNAYQLLTGPLLDLGAAASIIEIIANNLVGAAGFEPAT